MRSLIWTAASWSKRADPGQRLPYDHRHRTSSDKGVPYAFESTHRLLEDFFAEVDRVIKEVQQ